MHIIYFPLFSQAKIVKTNFVHAYIFNPSRKIEAEKPDTMKGEKISQEHLVLKLLTA